MLGSKTTPSRTVLALLRRAVLPSDFGTSSALGRKTFAAQWPACMSPCRRFDPALTDGAARLGASVVRDTFTVEDFHLMLLAGLPAHSKFFAMQGIEKTRFGQG